ncbi:proline/serine-rich coiled-coil protein 1-like [Erpetoichthys calabaricus]|uniref:proline/serine-rich coiled-coil protein 1-like n=1 Tax=Erpetoichthys calabaricus TaxID=27687 RepID=UPI002234C8DF|nr:proline/serine-rich coiled-coil protein 1-like [Erpetoichthys calabaricus]
MEPFDEGFSLITEETLDFVDNSPSNSRVVADDDDEDDEEVIYIAPERGVAKNIDLNVQRHSKEPLLRWSPLSAEKLEEISREANLLARQLEKVVLQDSPKVKRVAFKENQENKPSPRRKTFLVTDSPVKSLLPTIDKESDCSTCITDSISVHNSENVRIKEETCKMSALCTPEVSSSDSKTLLRKTELTPACLPPATCLNMSPQTLEKSSAPQVEPVQDYRPVQMVRDQVGLGQVSGSRDMSTNTLILNQLPSNDISKQQEKKAAQSAKPSQHQAAREITKTLKSHPIQPRNTTAGAVHPPSLQARRTGIPVLTSMSRLPPRTTAPKPPMESQPVTTARGNQVQLPGKGRGRGVSRENRAGKPKDVLQGPSSRSRTVAPKKVTQIAQR